MKILALLLSLQCFSFSVFAATDPGSPEVTQCVKMQITKYFKNPNDVKFLNEVQIYITDDRNFDYVFFLDQGEDSSAPISLFVRKGNLIEATLWVQGFPYLIDISGCYLT